MGQFRVLDALTSLSFDHPPEHPRLAERVAFFRGELEQFLALAHRSGGDPQLPLGSFAGAMGLPQFMPSSWIRWGVDFDGDGRVDLRNSPADAIGSVANYFKVHGWQPGLPTHFPVAFDTARVDMDTLLAPDILPTFSATRFQALGALIEGPALSHPGQLALVELQNGEAPNSYVAGTENFYAITRYNQSSYYAMAVIDLAKALREARPTRPATHWPAPAPGVSTPNPNPPLCRARRRTVRTSCNWPRWSGPVGSRPRRCWDWRRSLVCSVAQSVERRAAGPYRAVPSAPAKFRALPAGRRNPLRVQ
jgi:hypothetical protein